MTKLNKQTEKEIEESREQIKRGEFISLDELKKNRK